MGESDAKIDRDIQRFNEDTESAAELPGRIRVSLFRFARAFPHRVQWWFVTLAVIGALAFFVHWSFLVAAVPVLIFIRRHWRTLRDHFLSGCLNAAKVVSLDPPLVAVSTDLQTGDVPCPVLRILPQPLRMMVPGDPEIGRRAAAVSLYGWSLGERDHWSTFHPLLVDTGTGSGEKIGEAIDRLDDEDWDDLEFALAQVKPPCEPGLYRIYQPLERPLHVLALPRVVEHAQDAQQRGLARTGWTHHRHELSLANIQVDLS